MNSFQGNNSNEIIASLSVQIFMNCCMWLDPQNTVLLGDMFSEFISIYNLSCCFWKYNTNSKNFYSIYCVPDTTISMVQLLTPHMLKTR